MIIVKSEREIELMRRAGKITAAARALAGEMVKPGFGDRRKEMLQDIAIFEHPGTRNAVNDLVIDGHAYAGGIAVVV